MSLTPADSARLDEMIAIGEALGTMAGDTSHQLVNRFHALHGEGMAAAEDRMLRIAGGVLLEHELGDLFETIYVRALEGCTTQPGEARRFLFEEPR